MTLQPDNNQDKILAGLTDAQQQAVTHIDGPLLILAGPGSGKTRVVTHRIAYMIQRGVPDYQIAALTFTNKAADEMRGRLQRLAPSSRVWTGTFHRFCSRLLRQHASLVGLHENFSIYDTDDSSRLLKEAIRDASVDLVRETSGRIASAISSAKNKLVTPEDYKPAPGNPVGAMVARVYPHYQKRLLLANAVDFDDLLLHTALLLRNNAELRRGLDQRFCYLMVDEYQDTNFAQYTIVRALSINYPNLAVTGDPDQSIYGWRGASIRNILDFEKDFPRVRVVRLERNYRSTKCILRAADQLIANNVQRKSKRLYTDNPEGQPVRLTAYRTGRAEADAIAARIANQIATGQRRPKDFAIFYRTNAFSRSLEFAMRHAGLPYQIVRGLEFYQRKEVKDILAYLHLVNNPSSDVALLRIINTPPRRIGKATLDRLRHHARHQGTSLLEAARQSGLIESLNKRSALFVAKFVTMYDTLSATVADSVEELVRRVLDQTGYRDWLQVQETEEAEQRLENIEELITDAREFDESLPEDGGLDAFLEQTALVADIDGWATEPDCVTMMTLHAAKGLEFPVVFIVAIEDNMLPHERSKDEAGKVEEERRLFFVGMTRAEQELHLSCVHERGFRGESRMTAPSQFLMELPRDEMEVTGQIGYGSDVDLDDELEDDFDWKAWEDDEPIFQVDAPPQSTGLPESSATGETSPKVGLGGVRTAADMMRDDVEEQPPCSPDTFRRGMAVLHPDYGLGHIVTLGGSGKRRVASVRFVSQPSTVTFNLAHSPLRPIKTGNTNQE